MTLGVKDVLLLIDEVANTIADLWHEEEVEGGQYPQVNK